MPRKPIQLKDLLYQFLRPFAFMGVRGPTLHVYRLILPIVATVLSCAVEYFLPKGIELIGDKSVSDYMATFFVALPGFFIAALAAVVAFNGGDLDTEMPSVRANIMAYGDTVYQPITLRVFLSYLFSYLTILSFVGFFVCISGSLLAPSVTEWLNHLCHPAAYGWRLACQLTFTGLIAFISSSVVFCTGLGLYFLAERVNQTLLPNPMKDKEKSE